MNQSTQAPPIERNMAEDLAALDQAHRERMDACECPSCIPPRIGDLLPDVLAEMRRREARR